MKADSQPNDEVRARVLHGLLEEIYGVNDLKRDDLRLAHEIRSLKRAEQDIDKLKHAPPELQNAIRNTKGAFLDRVYQAIVVRSDSEFSDRLTRVVKHFEKQDATELNPSGAAIKKECASVAFELILKSKDKLPTRYQIKRRLREKGIRVDGINWPRVWKSLGLDDPAFAGPLGRPKK
jgi:hypothetical protein